MLKHIGRLFFLYAVLQIVAVACCPDQEPYYSKILSVQVAHYSVRSQLQDSAIVPRTLHRLRCTINQKTIAVQSNSAAFPQKAYATSCEAKFLGLKSDVVKFEVYCDKDVLNTPRGTPLPYDAMRVYTVTFTDDAVNKRLTVDQWLAAMNTGSGVMTTEWYIEFQEPISSSEYLRFSFLFEQENGAIFQAETQAVRIEE